MHHCTGSELLERCASDRGEATWDEFLVRFRPAIRGGVHRALNRSNRAARTLDPDDLVQEVFCRLLEEGGARLKSCQGPNDRVVGAYLSRIAESVVRDHLRARNAEKRGSRLQYDENEANDHSLVDSAPDPGPTPEERALLNELRRRFHRRCLHAAGARTGSRDVEILHLALFESYTSREIATMLGGSLRPSSIDSRVHRMRRRLARSGFHLQRR